MLNRSKKLDLLVVLALWIAVILGCASSNSNTNVNTSTSSSANYTSNSSSNRSATYDLDLPGQLRRVNAEGLNEDAIRANVQGVDKTITYEQLKKNSIKHAGKAWAFTGKILEIREIGEDTVARVSLDDWGSKPIYIAAPMSTEFVENNRVYVVGYLAGNYSYESQAGWNLTIPALAARAILKPSEAAKYKSNAPQK